MGFTCCTETKKRSLTELTTLLYLPVLDQKRKPDGTFNVFIQRNADDALYNKTSSYMIPKSIKSSKIIIFDKNLEPKLEQQATQQKNELDLLFKSIGMIALDKEIYK